MISLEEGMELVGNRNAYQFRIFILLAFIMFIYTFSIMSPTYSYIKPKFLCNGENECEENQQNCKYSDFRIDPNNPLNNLVTDFQLYCDKDYLIQVGASINFLGSVLGGTALSYLADRKGRKYTFMLGWIFCSLSFLGIYFSQKMWMVILFTFFMGFFEIGNYILIPVIINEICETKIRQTYTQIILVTYSISEIVTALSYYYLNQWRMIQLYFIVIPSFLCLIAIYWLAETPKFLYSKAKYKATIKSLNYIAKINNKAPIHDIQLEICLQNKNKKQYTFIDLFKFKSLRNASIGFFLISYALHLVYFGGQYGMKDIAQGNMVYVMGVTVGLSEMMTYIFTTVIIHKIKRRMAIQISFILSVIGCLVFLFYGFHEYKITCSGGCFQEIITIILLCSVRIFNTIGFGIQGLYSNEFYPTPIRAIGSGFLFSTGILGSFTAPYITMIAKSLYVNPFLIIAIFSSFGCIGTMLTSETKGIPMKDQIDECKLSQIINSDDSNLSP